MTASRIPFLPSQDDDTDLPPGPGADGSWTFCAAPHPADSALESSTAAVSERETPLSQKQAEPAPIVAASPALDAEAEVRMHNKILPLPVHVILKKGEHGADQKTWTHVLIRTPAGHIRSLVAAEVRIEEQNSLLKIGIRRYAAVTLRSGMPGWLTDLPLTVATSQRQYDRDRPATLSLRPLLSYKEFLAESARDQLAREWPASVALIYKQNAGFRINHWRYTARAEFKLVSRRLAQQALQDEVSNRRAITQPPVLETPRESSMMLEVIPPFLVKKGSHRHENHDFVEQLSAGLRLPLLVSPPLAVLAPLYLGFPNFAEALDIVADALALCARTPNPGTQPLRLPPILLAGPPGIGKSAFCIALAKALGYGKTPPLEIDFAVTTASFVLSGLAPSWSGSRQGLVLDTLIGSPGIQSYANAMIVGNEVDKATAGLHQQNVLMPLLTLLEPGTATRFRDEFVDQAIIDSSYLVWVLTANDITELPEPLLSRIEVVNVPVPTATEMRGIAERMYASLRVREAWGMSFPQTLGDDVIQRLAESPNPREMRRALNKALGQAARNGAPCVRAEYVSSAVVSRRPIGF